MNTILTGELITVDGEERRYPRNHEPLMRWAKASGFDPDVTVSDSMTVDGDTITAEQFVFDAQGELIPTKDGGDVETTTITRQQAYPIPAPLDPTTPQHTPTPNILGEAGMGQITQGAIGLHELFTSLIDAGLPHDDALHIIVELLKHGSQ